MGTGIGVRRGIILWAADRYYAMGTYGVSMGIIEGVHSHTPKQQAPVTKRGLGLGTQGFRGEGFRT